MTTAFICIITPEEWNIYLAGLGLNLGLCFFKLNSIQHKCRRLQEKVASSWKNDLSWRNKVLAWLVSHRLRDMFKISPRQISLNVKPTKFCKIQGQWLHEDPPLQAGSTNAHVNPHVLQARPCTQQGGFASLPVWCHRGWQAPHQGSVWDYSCCPGSTGQGERGGLMTLVLTGSDTLVCRLEGRPKLIIHLLKSFVMIIAALTGREEFGLYQHTLFTTTLVVSCFMEPFHTCAFKFYHWLRIWVSDISFISLLLTAQW